MSVIRKSAFLPACILLLVSFRCTEAEVSIIQSNGTLAFPGFVAQVQNNLTFIPRAEVCEERNQCRNGTDNDSEDSLKHFGQLLFHYSPPFDLTKANISESCRLHSSKYMDDLHQMKLWALQMYDSTAKLPSGLLNGNVKQLGDFDMCLKAKTEAISGKYCLVSMQLTPLTSNAYTLALHKLTESHFHFRSQLDDPGHRVPRLTGFKWALCVPHSCSAQDIHSGLRETTRNLDHNWKIDVRVDPELCYSEAERRDIPTSTKIAAGFFATLLLVTVLAAVYDWFKCGDKNAWIVSFSLLNNAKSVLSMEESSQDIAAIHGIRFINALCLYVAHKSMAVFFVPYVNRTEMVEFLSKPWSVVSRGASLYTDPFIMFSGTLTAYSLFRKLQKNNKIHVLEEYSSRVLRILPTLAALIAFCTLVLPWTNNGPMWKQVVTRHSDICKKYWWRNLLFVHNYFGFDQMCLTHTHHVGIDTQLFFVAPFLVLAIWRWGKNGVIFVLSLAIVSTIMRYYVTVTMGLSNYIHFGTSIKQLFTTADYMYTLPTHRATVYIMGVLLGYMLRKYNHLRFSKVQLRIGDAAAICSFCLAYIGPSFMGSLDYVFNARDAAWYAAFAPIFWCFAFAWLVFTTHLGQGGLVGRLLSSKVFRVWTKISYTFYLAQFPVFFFNVGRVRTAQHYELFPVMANVLEFGWVLAFACALTLLFEMPFQNVRNIVFQKNPSAVEERKVMEKIR